MIGEKIRDEEIKIRSYYIWQREGGPPGREWEHWFRAKAELTEEKGVFPRVDAKPALKATPDISAAVKAKKRSAKKK